MIDWELVCHKKEMRATAQVRHFYLSFLRSFGMISTEDQISKALFMAGVMIGSYSFGWLSDRAGRKPAFFVAVVIQVKPQPQN